MSESIRTVLVVGATGSIGRPVVAEALAKGFKVRALVRDQAKAASLPAGTDVAPGDLTDGEALAGVVEGIDAVIFTHGSRGGGPTATEAVDYGGVHNILRALSGRPVRIVLMTAIGVTVHDGSYNRASGAHDWKRRAERVVRASGNVFTIVRPGWFDYNDADQHRIVMLQGDRRRAGDASDGAIARRQIAEVLVASLTSPAAARKTFELVAGKGPAQSDLGQVFAALQADPRGNLDGVLDPENFPLADEPVRVLEQLEAIRNRAY
ncbi:SDR family oxidoreductase [Paeniglutamicibacter kerguelensis]|uniref:Uncharacterized protein YbjT (DUF2867 family) n=1 Tax=Paeniglutamicibacter kerguelensis TaxID=254788 RepID=A0ABS4XJC8_9MICC|nr:SDR family oxidoreductase [Paeniglutamicibacter kerguelensis]MBP2388564.1 uncharacterized protein YbjT (DUF2867 family) [Paeniglutamicibacter kerguelensis]